MSDKKKGLVAKLVEKLENEEQVLMCVAVSELRRSKYAQAREFQKEGEVASKKCDYKSAFSLYKRSIDIFEELNDMGEVAVLYRQIGVMFDRIGNSDKSLDYLLKAQSILEDLVSNSSFPEHTLADILFNIGTAYESKGESYWDVAKEFYEKSLKSYRKLTGRRQGQANCLTCIGKILVNSLFPGSALVTIQKALKIYEELRYVDGEMVALYILANAYEQLKKFGDARECYEKMYKNFERLQNPGNLASFHEYIGNNYFGRYNVNKEKALYHLKKSSEIRKKLKIQSASLERTEKNIQEMETEKESLSNITLKKACEGTKFQDYEVVRKIGGIEFDKIRSLSLHGGCASVFLVKLKKYPDIDEAVMKVFHRFTNSEVSKKEYTRIVLENRIDVRCNYIMNPCHHFVDQFEGILEDLEISKTTVFLIFPRAVMDLSHYIKLRKKKNEFPLNESEFLKLTYQLLQAIVSLHAKGIVHCDLKNDNILISSRGNILLTDFEFHKSFHSCSGVFPLWGIGSSLLNLEFKVRYTKGLIRGGFKRNMPPEIMNVKEGDFLNYSKSDVFSAGMCIYSLLSEDIDDIEDPFLGVDPSERDLSDYVPLDESIPKDIRELVDGMLHTSFSKRYSCRRALKLCKKMYEERMAREKEEMRDQFKSIE